ncbi:MAG: SlyX protein [Spirochaetae bacterium HGW-Spirochaetae-7]|jgi:uncharacterized coiled-coil protein SlyX|nr:MAG: SlyX protein [Spirochaetae bacterium HGW-Spirochaetae-7]
MPDIDGRLDRLEAKFAYIEKATEDLDGLVLEYGRRTERLEAMMQAMVRRISEMAATETPDMPERERPPHY